MTENSNSMSIIVFNHDLDRVLAAFILATAAASSGIETHIFFTFWGLNVLKKEKSKASKKNIFTKIFSYLTPKGPKKLKISRLNFGGIGTKIMKYLMKKNGICSLPQMIANAQEMGVKMIACALSMEIMGIEKEDLIDGLEYANATSYLGYAKDCQTNLFI